MLYQEIESLNAQIKELTAKKDEKLVALYILHKDALDAKDEGVVNIVDHDNGYKLKVTKKLNRTIDQEKALAMDGLGLAKKFSWSKTEYNKLSDADKKIANDAITTKVGKPYFQMEKLNESTSN